MVLDKQALSPSHTDPASFGMTPASAATSASVGSAETLDESVQLRRPLHQVLASVDLDILQELERFRDWQQSQAELGSCLAEPVDPTQQTLPSMSRFKRNPTPTYLEPQDVVEDLDVESPSSRSSLLSPLSVLFLWLLSCAGFGVGILWLVAPGDPNRPQLRLTGSSSIPGDTLPEAAAPQGPPVPDLMALPLIPVSTDDIVLTEDPLQPDPQPKSALQPQFDPDSFRVERLALARNVLDLTQRPISTLSGRSSSRSTSRSSSRSTSARPTTASVPRPTVEEASTPSPPRPAPQRVSDSPASDSVPTLQLSPELTPQDPDITLSASAPSAAAATQLSQPTPSLGPDQGEGTFVVLMNYQGDNSLEQARQLADGAFVKNIDGQQYVQLASFEQLEYARHMQEDLQRQGVSVEISPSN